MTLSDIAANNTELLQGFAKWLNTLQLSVVNREPGLTQIRPGYRAIAKWIKDRMVQEVYFRIRQNITMAQQGGAAAGTVPAGSGIEEGPAGGPLVQ
jgi:hypothetical protein